MDENFQKSYEENIKKTNRWTFRILVLGLLSLATPWLFTAFEAPFSSLDFTQTGQIGDTIGGITAPFLSLVGSFLVFLSFRAQIDMNRIQFAAIQKQFQKMDEDKLKERFNEMQKVIDVINDRYLGQFVSLFRGRTIQIGLSNISFEIRKGDFNSAKKHLSDTYSSILQLGVLVHLKDLVEREENNNTNHVQLNFIKIQIDMIFQRIDFNGSYPSIIQTVKNLESHLKNKHKWEYETLQKINLYLVNLLKLNVMCVDNGTP